jgi:hypothetical protein
MIWVLLLLVAWDGPPGPNAEWYGSLQNHGQSCCSIGDCREVDVANIRVENGHYQVFVTNPPWDSVVKTAPHWVDVPDAAILHRPDNPTGKYVICFTPAMGVLCAVPPEGT